MKEHILYFQRKYDGERNNVWEYVTLMNKTTSDSMTHFVAQSGSSNGIYSGNYRTKYMKDDKPE